MTITQSYCAACLTYRLCLFMQLMQISRYVLLYEQNLFWIRPCDLPTSIILAVLTASKGDQHSHVSLQYILKNILTLTSK